MITHELCDLTLAEAAAAVRARSVSPVELTESLLERIARLDNQLRTYITVTPERALEQARAAEQAITRGEVTGPLHGVPLALKDLFDTAGVATTGGSGLLRDRVPDRDATVVTRLRQAGTVLLGKLNMHEFAYGVTTTNPHHGICRNPWNPEHIPGGSSGGSGAAVAARLCYGSLGSDTGGSIRIPAALCGITGLKPTYGRVSRAGVLPLSWTLDHVGPMTRTVTDAALLLQAIAGHDPADAASASVPVPDYTVDLERGARGLRLGVPRGYFYDGAQPAVLSSIDAALDVYRSAGASIIEVAIPDLDLAGPAFAPLISVEAAACHLRNLRQRPEAYGDDVRLRLEQGALYPAVQYVQAQQARQRVVAGFEAAMRDVDVLVTPAVPVTAPAIHTTVVATPNPLTRCTFPLDVCGFPAMSIPCGFDHAGLPVGLQLIGRPWDEATVLRAGRAYERETDWTFRRPPLAG